MVDREFFCPDCLRAFPIKETRRWKGKGMDDKGQRLCNFCADVQEDAYNRYYQGDRIEAMLEELLTRQNQV